MAILLIKMFLYLRSKQFFDEVYTLPARRTIHPRTQCCEALVIYTVLNAVTRYGMHYQHNFVCRDQLPSLTIPLQRFF
jgi:hypothetical protein